METRVTFRLAGDATLTAAAVTRRLGIQPTRALEAGDPRLPGDLWLDVCCDDIDH